MTTRDAIREFLQNEFILEVPLKYDEVYRFTFTPDFPGPLSIVLKPSPRLEKPTTSLDPETTVLDTGLVTKRKRPAMTDSVPDADVTKDRVIVNKAAHDTDTSKNTTEKPQPLPKTKVVNDPLVVDDSETESEDEEEYLARMRDLEARVYTQSLKKPKI